MSKDNQSRLAAFAEMDESEMDEGTSTYYKFTKPDEFVIGTFEGCEFRALDPNNNPDKKSECAVIKTLTGEKMIMAQTIVVKELKKKWDEEKEVGFPVKIIYKGEVGTGSDKYQSFRLLFEPK